VLYLYFLNRYIKRLVFEIDLSIDISNERASRELYIDMSVDRFILKTCYIFIFETDISSRKVRFQDDLSIDRSNEKARRELHIDWFILRTNR